MTEQTIHIELPILLPGVSKSTDARALQLENAFIGMKGVLRAHLECEDSSNILCLHYDPGLITLNKLQSTAVRTGLAVSNRFQKATLDIAGMDCADCATVIEHGIGRLDGVLTAHLNYPLRKLRIDWDTRKISQTAIEKRIHLLGYQVVEAGKHGWFTQNRELIFSITAGVLVFLGWGVSFSHSISSFIPIALFITAYLVGGWDVARHAIGTIIEKRFDTDLLMILAAIGAALLGDFFEGGLLIFLFSLGHSLEERALGKARKAIYALQDLTPKTAIVRRNLHELEISVDDLVLDETIIVAPGIRLPADGKIIKGSSYINQAPVTGESIPLFKQTGDHIFAGSINGESSLEIKVTHLASDSTISRIVNMVEEAQTQRSPTQATIERFSTIYVPSILAITVLATFLPLLWDIPLRVAFLRAMTFLVAASPCALALGTPSAILAGIAQAARNGILIKGGIHLENLGKIKAIGLDKTGTLTTGSHTISEVISLNGMNKEEILRIAGLLESRSAHPLAKAITTSAVIDPNDFEMIDDLESLAGLGLRGSINGVVYWIGNQRLMDNAGIRIDSKNLSQLQLLHDQGNTVMLLAGQAGLIGMIALADNHRPTAIEAISKLKELGLKEIALITGDHKTVGDSIGRQVGVTSVYTDLLPEDKLKIIREMIDKYGVVAMVGDGVNDAPALANSTVGIAMGGAGTDVALETADVVLMANDLSRLPSAIKIGKATSGIIAQNLFLAFFVIIMLGISSLTGIVGIGLAVLLHEGSTIVVVLNSLRLLKTPI